jgi:hypothetical protein
MKCAIFVSDKMAYVPIVECGSIFLAPGDELIVRESIAKQVKDHYATRLLQVGECEAERLVGGHFEVRKTGKHVPAVISSQEPLDAVAEDRSMASKHNRKSKAQK